MLPIKPGSRLRLIGSFSIAALMGVNACTAWQSEGEVRAIANQTQDSTQKEQLLRGANKLNNLAWSNIGWAFLFGAGGVGLNLAARRRVGSQTPGMVPDRN